MLENEKLILNELNNVNLVKCYYIFSNKEFYYYVMEFVGGGDTNKLFQRYKNINEEVIKLFIAEVSMGLDYLHNHNIFHKDIKPENILITNTVR